MSEVRQQSAEGKAFNGDIKAGEIRNQGDVMRKQKQCETGSALLEGESDQSEEKSVRKPLSKLEKYEDLSFFAVNTDKEFLSAIGETDSGKALYKDFLAVIEKIKEKIKQGGSIDVVFINPYEAPFFEEGDNYVRSDMNRTENFKNFCKMFERLTKEVEFAEQLKNTKIVLVGHPAMTHNSLDGKTTFLDAARDKTSHVVGMVDPNSYQESEYGVQMPKRKEPIVLADEIADLLKSSSKILNKNAQELKTRNDEKEQELNKWSGKQAQEENERLRQKDVKNRMWETVDIRSEDVPLLNEDGKKLFGLEDMASFLRLDGSGKERKNDPLERVAAMYDQLAKDIVVADLPRKILADAEARKSAIDKLKPVERLPALQKEIDELSELVVYQTLIDVGQFKQKDVEHRYVRTGVLDAVATERAAKALDREISQFHSSPNYITRFDHKRFPTAKEEVADSYADAGSIRRVNAQQSAFDVVKTELTQHADRDPQKQKMLQRILRGMLFHSSGAEYILGRVASEGGNKEVEKNIKSALDEASNLKEMGSDYTKAQEIRTSLKNEKEELEKKTAELKERLTVIQREPDLNSPHMQEFKKELEGLEGSIRYMKSELSKLEGKRFVSDAIRHRKSGIINAEEGKNRLIEAVFRANEISSVKKTIEENVARIKEVTEILSRPWQEFAEEEKDKAAA